MSVLPLGPASPLDRPTRAPSGLGARVAPAAPRLWHSLRPIMHLACKAIVARSARRAVRELQNLDDRLLRDIGLNRALIEQAVRQGRQLDLVLWAAEWMLRRTHEASRTRRAPRGSLQLDIAVDG